MIALAGKHFVDVFVVSAVNLNVFQPEGLR